MKGFQGLESLKKRSVDDDSPLAGVPPMKIRAIDLSSTNDTATDEASLAAQSVEVVPNDDLPPAEDRRDLSLVVEEELKSDSDDDELEELEEVVIEMRKVPRPEPENGVVIIERDVIPVVPQKAKQKSKGTYGDTGVPVGTAFAFRKDARQVHSPMIAGISGDACFGCFSIALSGGYAHDLDQGDKIVYTGHGGQGSGGEMISDQKLTSGNISFIRSMERGQPIRVLRGYKVPSPYQPVSGYRYDGLYNVIDWWPIRDANGFKLYQFMLQRVPGQVPLTAPRESWTAHKIHSTWKSMPKARNEDDDVEEVVVTRKRYAKRPRRNRELKAELLVSDEERFMVRSDEEALALEEFEMCASRHCGKLPARNCSICGGNTRFYDEKDGAGLAHFVYTEDGNKKSRLDPDLAPECSYSSNRSYFQHVSNNDMPLIHLQFCPCCSLSFRLPQQAEAMEKHLMDEHMYAVEATSEQINTCAENQKRIRSVIESSE